MQLQSVEEGHLQLFCSTLVYHVELGNGLGNPETRQPNAKMMREDAQSETESSAWAQGFIKWFDRQLSGSEVNTSFAAIYVHQQLCTQSKCP